MQNIASEESVQSRDIVTVWVHGTSQNPLIRYWHASPVGITHFDELSEDFALKGLGAELHNYDKHEFPKNNFYTFGWSGKLSFAARKEAGELLALALRNILDIHQMRFGKKPGLRLITHSHGCNVALNASDQFVGKGAIVIDELVLLACPVQQETAHKLESKAFKKIYALYSTFDLTQVIDPQGLYLEGKKNGAKLFSERRFKSQPNLFQAQIRWNGLGLSHIGFVRQRFAKALPAILSELKKGAAHDFLLDLKHCSGGISASTT